MGKLSERTLMFASPKQNFFLGDASPCNRRPWSQSSRVPYVAILIDSFRVRSIWDRRHVKYVYVRSQYLSCGQRSASHSQTSDSSTVKTGNRVVVSCYRYLQKESIEAKHFDTLCCFRFMPRHQHQGYYRYPTIPLLPPTSSQRQNLPDCFNKLTAN